MTNQDVWQVPGLNWYVWLLPLLPMSIMTSSNGNIFRVTGLLWRESMDPWSPMDSPQKGQWRGALMFSLICAWTNGCANNEDAADLRRHHAHYDVTVMAMTYHGRRRGSMRGGTEHNINEWKYSGWRPLTGVLCNPRTAFITSGLSHIRSIDMLKTALSSPWFQHLSPEPWCNIKMSSYQYMASDCGYKTIAKSPKWGISYAGKTTYLYWTRILGWGLLSRFPPFRNFPNFSTSPKYMLAIKYHVQVWQVSPQPSCIFRKFLKSFSEYFPIYESLI